LIFGYLKKTVQKIEVLLKSANNNNRYFTRRQVLIAQDHDDMEFMARKLKEEYEKWGFKMNFEKKLNIYMYRRRKRKFKI
jgi:hypothetical protein